MNWIFLNSLFEASKRQKKKKEASKKKAAKERKAAKKKKEQVAKDVEAKIEKVKANMFTPKGSAYKPPSPAELMAKIAKQKKDKEYKPPSPMELKKKIEKKKEQAYKPPSPVELKKKIAKQKKDKEYKPPSPAELKKKTAKATGAPKKAKAGTYKVPSPMELKAKAEKAKKKEAKKKEPKSPMAKKRSSGGLAKKPPKQKTKPGGSKAKAKVDQVPAQLMHCVNAVKDGRPSSPGGKRRPKKSVRAAWNICRWSLTRYGYLKPPYKIGAKIQNVRRTQKGSRASMKHAMEPEGPAKYKRFKDLFREIEPTV